MTNKTKNWVLTDTFADVHEETFAISDHGFPQAFPSPWKIEKRVLRGGRRDGVEAIDVDNGALSFTVLPTRGMGIWRGWYRGSLLGWLAPVQGPVHPAHVNLLDRGGLGWLEGFDEWICRCGLHSNGPPCPEEHLTLHGRIANVPAHHVEVQVQLEPPYELKVIGQMVEGALFFPRLRLTTTITTMPGSNALVIEDVVDNLSSRSAELELLYHCNFGPPFLGAGSRVRAPIREMAPRDARAAEGIAQFESFEGPTAGFAEQVYFYDLLANSDGWTLAVLHNAQADRGVAVRMAHRELPRFTVWKNTAAAEDGYVVGLEPATNYPNPKPVERDRGRVVKLKPSDEYRATVIVEVHDTAEGVAGLVREVQKLQGAAAPKIHKKPQPEFSG